MSSAATMSQLPTIPPRPSRSSDKSDSAGSQPKVPPRPLKRFDRSMSPNPDRFAQSPFNEGLFQSKSPRKSRFGSEESFHVGEPHEDPIQRPGSVAMPSVGEEGNEYDVVQDELVGEEPRSPPGSPEQTRSVAKDLKLHAPKPSVPAQTSKERVMAVTRTDSDRAASFGIGRPSQGELPERGSFSKKRPSSMSQASENDSAIDDEEHGIPEIGQRVPMNPHLGDVQAPSPALHASNGEGSGSHTPRHHSRKHSSRGGLHDPPPGSYGLHGHSSTQPTDKLQKAWYEKHPDSWKRESAVSLHDRQNDYAMSSQDLNKIVRGTREAGKSASGSYTGTPSEEVGYQASEEFAQRLASRPGSTQPKSPELRRVDSPRINSPIPTTGSPAIYDDEDDDIIHVDAAHNRSRSFLANPGEENLAESEDGYHHPILAADEVAKDPGHHWEMQAAVEPHGERRESFYDDEASSRPTSRPASLYHNNSSNVELSSTPLEDVIEYEPLFPEEEEKKRAAAEKNTWKPRHKFPSKDIWEDAPDSVNATAVVSTPEAPERLDDEEVARPETPAAAFARHQEQLAEKESLESDNFVRKHKKPMPMPLEQVKAQEGRPRVQNRFPSRDIWEDTPESLMHQAVIGSPEPAEEAQAPAPAKPNVPSRPQKTMSGDKPAIPERPKPKQTPSDEGRPRPPVSDKPKPQVPARPTKTLPSGVESKEQDSLPKQKPAVPARPVGSKIQALQAGFMSDLNKRLQLGPQGANPKKEESPAADMMEEKKEEKVPLSDARKGRARGPQRRAPAARSPAPVAELKGGAPTLSFSPLRSCWSIGDDGILEVDDAGKAGPAEKAAAETSAPVPEARTVEPESEAPDTQVETAEPTAEEDALAEQLVPEPEPELELEPAPAPVAKEQHPEAEVSSGEKTVEEESPREEVKTLASNMAGESVLEATLDEKKDEIEPVDVEATGGDKD